MKCIVAVALAALTLTACGGGSLPVTQPIAAPQPLTVTPTALEANVAIPANNIAAANGVATISGGVPPYSIKFDCPTNGATAALQDATITVTAITPYIVGCPLQVSDSKGNELTVQVTLNFPN